MKETNQDRGASLLASSLIAVLYAGCELLWFARVHESSITCALLAPVSGIAAWVFMGKVLPRTWPVSLRLLLLLGIAIFANATLDMRVGENLSQFQTLDGGSDDFFYLQSGAMIAQNISASPDMESYLQTFTALPRSPHLGFLVALGHLFTLVPTSVANQIRLVFLLNLFAIQMIAALIAAAARIDHRRFAGFLALYLFAGYDLFFFAAEVRKDVWVTFCLLTVTGTLHALTRRQHKNRSLALTAAFGMALYFLRNFYCVLPLAGVAFALLRVRYNAAKAAAWGAIAVIVAIPVVWFVRQSLWFTEALTVFRTDGIAGISATGLGAQIYNLPVVGPLLYGAITPLPPTLGQFVGNPLWTSALRGAGTILVLTLVLRTCAKSLRQFGRLDAIWWSFAFVGVMAFISASYGSIEARHKLAAIPCLLICYYLLDARGMPARQIVHMSLRSVATLRGAPRMPGFATK